MLRLPLIVNQVAEIDLAPLRSGASLWGLVESGVDDELLTVLAMPIAVNASMTALWLGANGISATGAAAIADAIAVNASLKALLLNRNKIGDAGAAAIANAITVNASMKSLDLGCNEIGDTGAAAISSAIALNASLTALMCVGFTTNLHPLPFPAHLLALLKRPTRPRFPSRLVFCRLYRDRFHQLPLSAALAAGVWDGQRHPTGVSELIERLSTGVATVLHPSRPLPPRVTKPAAAVPAPASARRAPRSRASARGFAPRELFLPSMRQIVRCPKQKIVRPTFLFGRPVHGCMFHGPPCGLGGTEHGGRSHANRPWPRLLCTRGTACATSTRCRGSR